MENSSSPVFIEYFSNSRADGRKTCEYSFETGEMIETSRNFKPVANCKEQKESSFRCKNNLNSSVFVEGAEPESESSNKERGPRKAP